MAGMGWSYSAVGERASGAAFWYELTAGPSRQRVKLTPYSQKIYPCQRLPTTMFAKQMTSPLYVPDLGLLMCITVA